MLRRLFSALYSDLGEAPSLKAIGGKNNPFPLEYRRAAAPGPCSSDAKIMLRRRRAYLVPFILILGGTKFEGNMPEISPPVYFFALHSTLPNSLEEWMKAR